MKPALVGAVAVGVVVLGCESSNETVEVNVPKESKAAVLNVVSEREYGFYALSAARPQTTEDLSYWSLIVCLSDPPDMDLRIITYASVATKGMPFKSSRVFHVAADAGCLKADEPCKRDDSTVYVNGPGRIQIPLVRSEITFGSSASPARVFESCYEDLHKNPKSILLTRRIFGLKKMKELVELKLSAPGLD
jgi:hypothetical protein